MSALDALVGIGASSYTDETVGDKGKQKASTLPFFVDRQKFANRPRAYIGCGFLIATGTREGDGTRLENIAEEEWQPGRGLCSEIPQ
jgi:hypothetical protein